MRFGVKLIFFKERNTLLSPFISNNNNLMYYFVVLEYSEIDHLCRCSVKPKFESADKELIIIVYSSW